MKLYERETNSLLQSTKQVRVLLGNKNMANRENSFSLSDFSKIDQDINVLKRAMGAMQHHDAITGTEKEAVAHDYALRVR